MMPAGLSAQDSDAGGLVVGLTLSGQLEHDDGAENLRSDVGLTLNSRTRSQSFRLGLQSGFEAPLSGGSGINVQDPRLTLGYTLENRSALLSFDLSYQRSDIDDLTVTDPLDFSALVIRDGKRENGAANIQLEFGRDSPFGGTVGLSYSETNFLNANTATLQDSTTLRGDLRLRYTLTPTATLFTTFSLSELDRDGGTDTRREAISASLDVEVREDISATADLGLTRVVTDGASPRRVRDGLFYGLSVIAERPNGSISGVLDSDITENGRRTTVQVNRRLVLPRGAFTASIGASRNSDTNSTDPLYSLGYVQTLPRGQFNVDFSQTFSTTTAGEETLDSRLSLGFEQQLTPLSSLQAGLTLRDSNRLTAAGGADSNQLDLSLTYSHTLTERWDLFGGVSHTRREQEGGSSSTDDRIFLGLRTALEWRP